LTRSRRIEVREVLKGRKAFRQRSRVYIPTRPLAGCGPAVAPKGGAPPVTHSKGRKRNNRMCPFFRRRRLRLSWRRACTRRCRHALDSARSPDAVPVNQRFRTPMRMSILKIRSSSAAIWSARYRLYAVGHWPPRRRQRTSREGGVVEQWRSRREAGADQICRHSDHICRSHPARLLRFPNAVLIGKGRWDAITSPHRRRA